jgi:hypothetical protein
LKPKFVGFNSLNWFDRFIGYISWQKLLILLRNWCLLWEGFLNLPCYWKEAMP